MNTSRLTRRSTLAAGLGLALTGCAGGSLSSGGGDSADSASQGWNEPTASLSGVTFTFGGGAVNGPIDKVIAAFQKATGATVKRTAYPDPYEQSVLTKVATGDKPDLAAWQPTASELIALQAPTNLLTLDDAPWLSSLNPAVRDLSGLIGKTRYAALVTSPSVMGVYYNKSLFSQYGLTTPKNWADLVAAATTVKAAGGTPFFEAGAAQWPTQWWPQVQLAEAAKAGLWDRVNTNQEQFTGPTILGAITEYDDLVKQGLFNADIQTATFEQQADAVMTGGAAMVLQVDALLLQIQTTYSQAQIDDTLGWFPISKDGATATSIPDNKNGIVAFKTGDSKRQAAAKQFLNFWMTTYYSDFVSQAGVVSLKPDVPTPSTVPQVAKDSAASLADSVGSMQSLAIANPDLYINLANMLYGKVTPQQVAEATQNQFAQLAKAQGAKGF